MPISDEEKKVLTLCQQDQIYWSRTKGGSREYQANVAVLKQLIRQGLIMVVPDSCCQKDYLVTECGEALLKAP